MTVRQRSRPLLALSEQQLALFSMLLAVSLWGTTYVAAKFALRDLGPMSAAFARFGLACLVTWPLLLLTGGLQRIPNKYLPALVGSALFQTTLYFALQYTGLRYTTASNTSLLVNTRPLVIALLSPLLLHERVARAKWGGLLLAFTGVVVLVGVPGADLPPNHLFGDFLIVLNALSGGLGIICAKRVMEYFKPFTALVYQITLGALGLLPLALIETGGQIPAGSPTAWASIAYMAVLCTAIPQALLNMGLARMKATQAAPFFYITPILNIIVAYFMLGEPLTWALAVGGALILLGTYLANKTGEGANTKQGAHVAVT